MSLLDEATTQQVVYGPDGKAYGNPAIARNAGVNQYYREDGTPYPVMQQPVPIPSFGGLGGTDPYSRIIGQMGGGTPYQRIMGQMPLLQNPYAGMSGGYNNFQGGYNPNLYSNPAATRAIRQLGFGGGGGMGGGGGGNDNAGGFTNTFSDLTPAQQAAYYAANPTMATITQLAQKAFGYTGLGALQRAMQPGFVSDQSLIAMGVNPAAYQSAKESFRASEIADMNAAAQAAANAAQNAQSMQSMQDAYNSDMAAASGGFDGYSGGGFGPSSGSVGTDYGGPADGGYGGSPADADSGAGGYGGGDGGGGDGGGDSGWAKGGKVTKSRLKGRNPPGPDDGYGLLQHGEYVIKKSAVSKYGQGLLDMINDGKIPAKKMKSLLG